MLCWRPKGKIAGILDIKHDARDLVPSTHLRQPHPTPGFAKLSPFWGGAGFYFGFTPYLVCVRLLLQVYLVVLKLSLPLSIDMTDR